LEDGGALVTWQNTTLGKCLACMLEGERSSGGVCCCMETCSKNLPDDTFYLAEKYSGLIKG